MRLRALAAAGALVAVACSRGLPAARGPADAASVAGAADAASLPPLPIEAQWIWVPGADAPDTWVAFRRAFVLDQLPPRASARIAVDSKYWLWVNGKLAVREGGLNRGPDRSGTFHDVVDLRPYLAPGRNVVAVLAWYWGRSARNHFSSGRGGLLVDLDLGERALRSDAAWRALRHPAFGPTAAPLPAGLLPGHNVRFDARLEPIGWTEPSFDDAAWPAAEERGVPPAAPWNQLTPRPVPLWRDGGLRDYVLRRERPGDGGATVVEARLPYDAQVTPYLELRAPAGLVIDLRTDHYSVPGGPGDTHAYNGLRTEYVTRDGVQSFEAPAWTSGEAVLYTIPAGVEVLALRYRETGYDAALAGSFHASDARLDRLWTKAQRTLYVNMRDAFMDCPDRERGQWMGDVAVEVPQTFYALDRRADLLVRKAISDLLAWRRPDDGALLTVVPGGDATELPSQGLHAAGERGFIWSYYRHTGDAGPLGAAYPIVRSYLGLWRRRADGLIEPRPGNWAWFDHGAAVDAPVLENAWYILALRGAIAMAGVVGGADDDARALGAQLAAHAEAFERAFWKGDAYRSGAAADDRANALAVVAGVVPPERYPAVRALLARVRNATPYMERYVLEALFTMGAADEALARMRARYQPMIDDAGSTLWEDFSGAGTRNHAWSGGPLPLLTENVAGLAPITPGWRTFRAAPTLADLDFVTASVPAPVGEVTIDARRAADGLDVTLVVPAAAQALVELPRDLGGGRRAGRVVLEGAVLWTEGGAGTAPAGLAFRDADASRVRFTAGPGRWRFMARP